MTNYRLNILTNAALPLWFGLAWMQPTAIQADQHVTDRWAAIKVSVDDAGFTEDVHVSCDSEHAFLHSDSYPDHEMMTGIDGTNEQVPAPAIDFAAPTPLMATLSDESRTRDSSFGIDVNGVPIFDYTGGGEMSLDDLYHHQTQHDTILTQQLDICGGHAGRGDDYHYHKSPICMIEQMTNADDHPIIGWAFDGYPIHGDSNPDGTPIAQGVLDVCDGQADETFGYRYHTSEVAPYIIQCLMGDVADIRDLPKIRPLRRVGGGHGKAPGRPPRGGVEDLVFSEDSTGVRSMDYIYEGEAYYVRYTSSGTSNCYIFKTRAVTDGGALETGEYCR